MISGELKNGRRVGLWTFNIKYKFAYMFYKADILHGRQKLTTYELPWAHFDGVTHDLLEYSFRINGRKYGQELRYPYKSESC